MSNKYRHPEISCSCVQESQVLADSCVLESSEVLPILETKGFVFCVPPSLLQCCLSHVVVSVCFSCAQVVPTQCGLHSELGD